MDIIYKSDWDSLKLMSPLWQNYNGSIGFEDRDLAVLDLGNVVALPKFFVQNNKSVLASTQLGANLILYNESTKNDRLNTGEKLKIFKTDIVPRDEQVEIFNKIRELKENNLPIQGLIVAAPGFGKTIVSLKTVELVQKKTLIIIPNDVLEGQFIDSTIQFTNLERDDIGVIQGGSINNIIKQNIFDKDIVVVKIQSLYAQLKNNNLNILYDLYSCFGLVIYDEAHIGNASDGYSKTGIMFKTDNILSLTATPYRSGINDFIFKNNTGPVLYWSEHQNLIPEIFYHNGFIEFTEQELNKLRSLMHDYVLFMATLNSILTTKNVYFEWIANWVEYRYSQGYEVAILFSTNKMVDKLGKILKRRGLDIGIIIGDTKKKLEKVEEYIHVGDYRKLLNKYNELFPRRKSTLALKYLKDDVSKIKITVKAKEDILKYNKVYEDEIHIFKTEVNNLTEREIMKQKKIIVSNFKFLSAGFDKSSLSCIIFGSIIMGKVPVIQSLGRIARLDKDKRQDIVAHFMFPHIYTEWFNQNIHILTRNIQTQYPSKFHYEGFDFGNS